MHVYNFSLFVHNFAASQNKNTFRVKQGKTNFEAK